LALSQIEMGISLPTVIRYHFRQQFKVPALEAYLWCTNFDENDHALMGDEKAQRQIQKIAESTVLLTDTFYTSAGPIEKKKVVELYPDYLSWNSTHFSGSNQFSQFLYKISTDEESISFLDFTGLHLDYEKANLTKAQTKMLSDELCSEDAYAWKLLAKAMEKDLVR
jgi:hypothetical protein